jgi:hypothetical protein
MASKIDLALAKSLIKEFQQQNSAEGGPALKTPDGSLINGFFIDRQSLDTILSDPKIVGISLNHAKHPDFTGKPGNIFTLVFAGAVPNTEPDATTPYRSSGDIFDFMQPCPPVCSTLL